jgi:hypothetical protein
MHFVRSFAVAATFLLSVGLVTTAQAETYASSTGKGTVGGTLLGAEAVLAVEAAFDISPNWLYYVGGAAGAIGGGIGGYYLEDQLSAKSNMLLLATGMLLTIPTTVAVLNAASYEQTAEYTQDSAPRDEAAAEPIVTVPASDATQPSTPPATDAASPQPATPATSAPVPAPTPAAVPTSQSTIRPRRPTLPTALVAMDDQANLHLGLPAVEVRETFSRAELQRFGVQQRTEWRVPLLRVAF